MHLEIPEPCHENWQDMTPKEKGRFCDKCCKVVVDFTNMATDKVIQFFTERKDEHVCGRFRPDQIATPVVQKNNFFSHRVKVFLAALYLVFGGMLFTGCRAHKETPRMGGVSAVNVLEMNFNVVDTPNLKNNNIVPRDTSTFKQHTEEKHLHGVVINENVTPDTTQIQNIMPTGGAIAVPDVEEHPLMGKPRWNPNDTIR